MKLRCSPYNLLLFLGLLGIFIFCHSPVAKAQCQGDFAYQSLSEDSESASGTIEIILKNADAGRYTFQVYKMEGRMILVTTREVSSPEKVIFTGLEPSAYYVKIEWGESCRKVLGGLEGIIITPKAPGR